MTRSRIPVAFKIVSFDAALIKLPDGREIEQPKHWRLLGPDGAIVGSGPYTHEGTITFLMRCAGEFMREHPQRARTLMANTQHREMRVPLELLTHDNENGSTDA